MQEKNEKISGIMADDNKRGSNIDSLIKKLMVEIITESEEDLRKHTIQSTAHRLEVTNDDDHDIDKEITELETLIKRLQAEIVEMSETTNKPGVSVVEDNSTSLNEASYASPEISNEEEPESDIGFPIISKDDGMLEQHVKMFAENISNIINASNNTNPQKDDLDNVRQNFNVLWDDPIKSNLDLTEKPTETISNKLSTALNFCILPSSVETSKPMLINSVSIESIKSTSNKGQIEQSEDISEYCEDVSPNDADTLNDTCDDDNIINNVAVLLNAETPYNLPGSIENHPSSVVNKTVPKDTIIKLPETVEADKTTTIKTSESVNSSDNTCTREPYQIIPPRMPTDTPEMMQTQKVTRENVIPMTDSILKSFNRKIRRIVGRGSEKSISNEKHEDLSDKDLLKAFPKSKSEPNKNFCTLDDDSFIIDPKNNIALTQDSLKNVIKDVSDTINTVNSQSNSEDSNIKAAENSNATINIVKNVIPKFVSNGLIINNKDNSKPVTENPSDTTTTTASLEIDPPSTNFIPAKLLTTVHQEMQINTHNHPQTVNVENIKDTPTPDLSRKNPEEDLGSSASTTSGTTALPKFFGSNLQTDEQQENVMKAEVKTVQPNAEVEHVQEKAQVEDVQRNKVEEDFEAEGQSRTEEYEDDDEKEVDEGDDNNSYDVD